MGIPLACRLDRQFDKCKPLVRRLDCFSPFPQLFLCDPLVIRERNLVEELELHFARRHVTSMNWAYSRAKSPLL